MADSSEPVLSVVVPVHNEAPGLERFNRELVAAVEDCSLNGRWEIIYCDDGSQDQTPALVRTFHDKDPRVKLLMLSRQFGKESALAAGISFAAGQAVLTIDGDGQHPVDNIKRFVEKWRQGYKVVVGMRRSGNHEPLGRRWRSRFFYVAYGLLAGKALRQGVSDFRLIDRCVRVAFMELAETERVNRGLVDWLGFRRCELWFTPQARQGGAPAYDSRRLRQLALNSIVSMSPRPLFFIGWAGLFITALASLAGTLIVIEQLLLADPLGWRITGTAMLSVFMTFLIGLVMVAQGVTAWYLSAVHAQSRRRPLYVIDREGSTWPL